MNKAAFLDRDGVINQKAPVEGEYIARWEELKILHGVAEAILLRRAGFHVIVVSNRRCVAKGLLTEAELDSMHRKLGNCVRILERAIPENQRCRRDLTRGRSAFYSPPRGNRWSSESERCRGGYL